MMRRLSMLLPLAASLMMTACSPQLNFVPNYLSSEDTPDYPPYNGPVEVFYQYPEAEFIELGTIRSQGQVWDSREGMIEEMQQVAAQIGANAIIVSPSIHDGFFSTLLTNAKIPGAQAIAIRVGDLRVPPWPQDMLIKKKILAQ